MIRFKELNELKNEILTEGILLEGKYLSMVKHFIQRVYGMRKVYYETHEQNAEFRAKATGRGGYPINQGNSINWLASELRGAISNLPDYFQPKLKKTVEKISGEEIGQFDPMVVERMFENNDYKQYFKLYTLTFLVECLVIESLTNEAYFDKLMMQFDEVFEALDKLPSDMPAVKKIAYILKLVPKIISLVGKFTSLAAKSFDDEKKPA